MPIPTLSSVVPEWPSAVLVNFGFPACGDGLLVFELYCVE
jgi:hypothetical protein